VIDRAAPPHVPVGDLAGKGRVLPVARGGGIGRHDVLVGHEHNRPGAGFGAGPRIEQALAVHELPLERGVDAGKRAFQVPVQVRERRASRLLPPFPPHGRERERLRQAPRGRVRIHGDRLAFLHRNLRRAVAQRVHEQYGPEGGDQQDRAEEQAFHHRAYRPSCARQARASMNHTARLEMA
jgi:hypothetical protein